MKIAIYGTGHVGNVYANFLSRFNKIIAYDKSSQKISKFSKDSNNCRILYTNKVENCFSAEVGLICVSTNWDNKEKELDVNGLFNLVFKIHKYSPKQIIIIKSTIPVGTTEKLIKITGYKEIYFLPEFLRASKANYDIRNPNRIIIGGSGKSRNLIKKFILLILKKEVPILLTSSTEAEAIKLFSNAYLAMRVSFFNELANYTYEKNICTSTVITGVSLDNRIGNYYNKPSFGFGGYCLPKDIREIYNEFSKSKMDSELFKGIIESNNYRKQFIANKIVNSKIRRVGIYNSEIFNSNKFMANPIIDIISILTNNNIIVNVYEKNISIKNKKIFNKINIYKKYQFKNFVNNSDIILVGNYTNKIQKFKNKIMRF